jgi:glycosyltransferase involved in cell wall biosynthesis
VFGATRLLRKLSGLKSVLHIHLDFQADDLRWALTRPPELTIVCAEFMRPAVLNSLGAAGHRNCRVRVIRNAVDLQRFGLFDKHLAKISIGANEKLPLAMIAANLSPHKGQITCIRAIAELKRRGRHVQLWVVGESRDSGRGYEKNLRAACAEFGVEELVHFTGFRNDVDALFRAADFVLLPSTSEGLPLSILEAQASGAIVLAAPTAGIPEVVFEDRTGYLVAADDPDGYADRIERLVGDVSKAREVRNASRRYVEAEHDLQRYCERVFAEYEGLLEARPGSERFGVS